MEAHLTNWGDFLVSGVFLFFLGIGWTFGRCYREFSRECESKCQNSIMEMVFKHSLVEAFAILCFTGLVLFLKILRSGVTFIPEKSEWNVWLAWVPFLIYALCRIAEERWSKAWRRIGQFCLAGTFMSHFITLYSHMHGFPVEADRTMYEPQCLLAVVTACFTFGEALLSWKENMLCIQCAGYALLPLKEQMQWIRCGCTMVQGTWLVQIGFTLCVSGREWQLEDNVALTVGLIFIWHCALSILIVHFVRKTVKSALCADPYIEGDFESYDEDYDVINIDGETEDLEIKHLPRNTDDQY